MSAVTFVEKTEYKVVAEISVGRHGRNTSEHFALPWPHQDKMVYFENRYLGDQGVWPMICFANSNTNKEFKANVMKDLQLKLQLIEEDGASKDVQVSSSNGVLFGPPDYLPEYYWHMKNRVQVTARFTAVTNKPQAEFDDDRKELWRDLLDSNDYETITLKIDGQELSLLKRIVQLKSPVFMAMLNSEMQESNAKGVVIKDMNYASMKAFVSFLYTSAIKFDSMSLAFDMIYAADKYDVPKLMLFARIFIASSMSVGNVLDVLVLADRHSVKDLEATALSFAAQNRKVVVKSAKYKEFRKNQSAALKLLDYFMTN